MLPNTSSLAEKSRNIVTEVPTDFEMTSLFLKIRKAVLICLSSKINFCKLLNIHTFHRMDLIAFPQRMMIQLICHINANLNFIS